MAKRENHQVNFVSNVAEAFLGKGSVRTIFEFGARYGEDSVRFARRFPQARVFSFECNPNTVDAARKATSKCPNIVFSERAISNRIGETSFFVTDPETTRKRLFSGDGNQGASSLFRATKEMAEAEGLTQKEVSVRTTTLSTVMKEHDLAGIDILWMDIQGAELLALQGLEDRIKDVSIIYAEVSFFHMYENQPLFDEILDWLEVRGFKHVGLYVESAMFLNTNASGYDAFDFSQVAVPESLKPGYKKRKNALSRAFRFTRNGVFGALNAISATISKKKR